MATLKVRNYLATLLWLLQPEASANFIASELERTSALVQVPVFRGFTMVSEGMAGTRIDGIWGMKEK